MKLIPLSVTDQVTLLATHKVLIEAADVAALGSGTSAALQILPTTGTLPAGTVVRFAGLRLVTAFDASDAGINSLLVEIGDGVDPDRFLAQTQIAVDGTEILWAAAGGLTFAYASADAIDATFTVAGGGTPTLAEINAGAVEIYLHVRQLADLNVVQ